MVINDKGLDKELKEKVEKIMENNNKKVIWYSYKRLLQNYERKPLKIIKKTVRGGQIIEYDGDILIIGDVNPDAYIIAFGSIIVMGTLRGIVHAGIKGDETAIVIALRLRPQQLRIGRFFARSPEDIDFPNYPEMAFIDNGKICVERI